MTDQILRMNVQYQTMQTVCEGPNCDIVIEQPDRPGRKRRFCTDRCRQANHRRNKKTANTESLEYARRLMDLR